jgi:8-oxo-dGTP pyrophosphatase MutT (NUDIX family)
VELVEVVDADGTVVDVVTRADMRAGRLRHRAVGIVVRRPGDGAVLVHRRADWKDVWPSYWDIAFGGVCDVGESWLDAARRELAEEAGVSGDLTHLGSGSYTDDDVDLVAEVFAVETEGPFAFADGEVVEVAWVAAADVESWASERDVCPDSLELARATWLRGPTLR